MRTVQKLLISLLLMLVSWQLVNAAGQPHVESGSHCAAFERYHQQMACLTEALEQGQKEAAADGHMECGLCWTVSLPAVNHSPMPTPLGRKSALNVRIEQHFSDAIPAEPERPNWAV